VVQAQFYSFYYTVNNGTVTITGDYYVTDDYWNGVLNIPSSILVNGVSLPVTSIGNKAFCDYTSELTLNCL